jgi:hypothetical protein
MFTGNGVPRRINVKKGTRIIRVGGQRAKTLPWEEVLGCLAKRKRI